MKFIKQLLSILRGHEGRAATLSLRISDEVSLERSMNTYWIRESGGDVIEIKPTELTTLIWAAIAMEKEYGDA